MSVDDWDDSGWHDPDERLDEGARNLPKREHDDGLIWLDGKTRRKERFKRDTVPTYGRVTPRVDVEVVRYGRRVRWHVTPKRWAAETRYAAKSTAIPARDDRPLAIGRASTGRILSWRAGDPPAPRPVTTKTGPELQPWRLHIGTDLDGECWWRSSSDLARFVDSKGRKPRYRPSKQLEEKRFPKVPEAASAMPVAGPPDKW